MKKIILGISIIFILFGSVLPTFAEFQMVPISTGTGVIANYFILDTKNGDVWLCSLVGQSLSYRGRACYGLSAVIGKDGLIHYYPAIPEAKEIRREK